MSIRQSQTWFAMLRRDRALFALVGCMVMLLNVLQPVTAAVAGPGSAICTMAEPASGPAPDGGSAKCPVCLACPASSIAAPAYKALPAAEPAFPVPAALPEARLPDAEPGIVAARTAEPPPAIRAPPSTV